MTTVVVRRSAIKMWLMAMGGIPLLIISLDVLTERRITRWLTDMIFLPEDVQIYEPRDVIFAWVMFLFATIPATAAVAVGINRRHTPRRRPARAGVVLF
jgi:hypothetical protein